MKKLVTLFAAILFSEILFAQTENEKLTKKLQDCYVTHNWNCVIENSTKLNESNPGHSDLYNYLLANAYFETTNFSYAKFYLAAAIAVNSKNSEYFFLQGRLFAIESDRANAILSFKQALDLQPTQNNFQTSIDFVSDKLKTDEELRETFGCTFCLNAYKSEKEREAAGVASVTSQFVLFKPYEEFKNILTCKLDINKQQKAGQTALTWAADGTDIRFINDLLKLGANPNVTTDIGQTPLLYSVLEKGDKVDFVKALLAGGASPYAQDISKKDALDYAKQKGNTNSAALIMNAIENSMPVSLQDFKDRAEFYFRHQEVAKAIPDFTAALKFDQNKEYFLTQRGVCYRATKKFELAIADFTESLLTSPYNGELYAYRGLCYFESGNKTDAETDFVKAIQLEPKLSEPIEKEKTRIATTH